MGYAVRNAFSSFPSFIIFCIILLNRCEVCWSDNGELENPEEVEKDGGEKLVEINCFNCSWIRTTMNPFQPHCNDTCDIRHGVCVKDIVSYDGKTSSLRRYCAVSNVDSGCYVDRLESGETRTVCICTNRHLCNDAVATSANRLWPMIIIIFTIATLRLPATQFIQNKYFILLV